MNKPYIINIHKKMDVSRPKPFIVVVEITVADSLFLD